MSSALAALIRKEREQHAFTFLALAGLLVVAFGLQAMQLNLAERLLSKLEVLSHFAMYPLLVAIIVVGHRLIVMEYYGRTQRFVETLPVPRGLMEWVKYLLGLGYLLLLAGIALAVAVYLARDTDSIDTQFVLIMAARLAAFVFALWGFAFAMGFLGRLRMPLYVLLAVLVMIVSRLTDFDLNRFGPMGAIDPYTFGFERDRVPGVILLQCLAIGGIGCALGLWLARVREGSVLEQLAKPLSSRERSVLFVMVLGALSAYGLIGDNANVEPYRFSSDFVLRSADESIAISYLQEQYREPAVLLLNYLQRRVPALWRNLGLESAPYRLRVVLNPSQAMDNIETLLSADGEGVVVEANFATAADYSDARLFAYAAHELLSLHTHRRALMEAKHWVLDGFSLSVALHGESPPTTLGAVFNESVLHALVATRQSELNAQNLRQWDRVSQQVGYPMADAIAYLGLRVLQEHYGEKALHALLRAVLARRSSNPLAQWWYERQHPIEDVFQASTGVEWLAFIDLWRARIKALKQDPVFATAYAQVPLIDAQIIAQARSAAYDLEYLVSLQSEQPVRGKCRMMHRYTGPVDAPLDPRDMLAEKRPWPRGELKFSHRIDAIYDSGNRIYAAMDCTFAALAIPIRVAQRRFSLP